MKGRLAPVTQNPDITSDKQSKAEDRQQKQWKTQYLKTAVMWLTFVKSSDIHLQNGLEWLQYTVVSSSDSEVSEIEDYESEVKGSPNSSNQATDVKEKQEAYSNKLIADAEWLLLYEQEKRTETELEKNTPKALQWTVLNIAQAKDNTFLKHFFQLWLACSDQIRNQCNWSLGFKSQITLDPYPFGEFCGPCYGLSNLDSSPLWKFIDNSSFHQKQLDFCTTLLSITQRYFWAKKRGVIGTLMEGTFVFGPVQSWAQ